MVADAGDPVDSGSEGGGGGGGFVEDFDMEAQEAVFLADIMGNDDNGGHWCKLLVSEPKRKKKKIKKKRREFEL